MSTKRFSTICKISFTFFSMLGMLNTAIAQQPGTAIAGNFKTIANKNGPTLGYSPASGVKIITVNGLNFKDLNKNGKLDKYEDWRLDVEESAKDLASKLTVEQIAGLMLYSGHQAIPAPPRGFGAGTYNGKPFAESGAKASDLIRPAKKIPFGR